MHPLEADKQNYLSVLRDEKRLSEKTTSTYEISITILFRHLTDANDLTALREHLRTLSATSYRHQLGIWRKFLRECAEPWKSCLNILQLPKVQKHNPPRALTEWEMQKVRSLCSTYSRKLFVEIGLRMGMRIGEMLKLTFDSLRGEWIRIERKGGKEQTLFVPEEVRALWVSLREERAAKGDEKLFEALPRYYQAWLKEISDRCNFQVKVTPHALRHTFASTYAQNGGNIKALQQALGHANLSMTEKYLHVNPQGMKEDYLRVMK